MVTPTDPKLEQFRLNEWYNVKVQAERLHLNSDTIGIHPQVRTSTYIH